MVIFGTSKFIWCYYLENLSSQWKPWNPLAFLFTWRSLKLKWRREPQISDLCCHLQQWRKKCSDLLFNKNFKTEQNVTFNTVCPVRTSTAKKSSKSSRSWSWKPYDDYQLNFLIKRVRITLKNISTNRTFTLSGQWNGWNYRYCSCYLSIVCRLILFKCCAWSL